MQSHVHRRLGCAVAAASLAFAAHGQSPRWAPGFANTAASVGISEVAAFDAGLGERLYVCSFDQYALSNPPMLRRHDGVVWDDFHVGLDGRAFASAVWNDGTGAALYLAGAFTQVDGVAASHVARFDGTSFTPLGSGLSGDATALAVHDGGSGAALYAVGNFASAGGNATNGVARWDGASWSAVPGLGGLPLDAVSFDDGSGPALYVAGDLLGPGGTAPNVARWNGSSWTYMPFLENGQATALCVHDDGSGPALYAANSTSSSFNQVVRWNGTFWTTVGPVFNGRIHDLASSSVGGPGLVAIGEFTAVGTSTIRAAARWNSTQWSAISSSFTPSVCNPTAFSITDFHPAGGGTQLVLGGCFSGGGPIWTLGPFAWDGTRTSSLPGGNGLNSSVDAQLAFDDGSGEALYAAGSFTRAGSTAASHVARWNGAAWSPLGAGLPGGARALVLHDDGGGARLHAGGDFGVRRWDGAAWTAVGTGLLGSLVLDLASFDDGSGARLHAATATFDSQLDEYVFRVARLDGGAWTDVGDAFDDAVLALAVHDSGSGPELYAGGAFTHCGAAAIPRLAVWRAGAWTSLGSGPDGTVESLLSFDDGGGPALVAGGDFTHAGPIAAAGIARFANAGWSAFGAGLGASVRALHAHDDGSGPALYAAGSFAAATPGGIANRIARWNGVAWAPLDTGIEDSGADVASLATFRSSWSSAPVLYAGGFFGRAGGRLSAHLAAWGGAHDGIATCFGDGVATACPCGNASPVGAGVGCRNSTGRGSRLRSDGEASVTADTFVLLGSDMPANSYVTYFQGSLAAAFGAGIPFDDGLRCVGGNTLRIASVQNQLGASFVPNNQLPTAISVRGLVPPIGGTRVYQARHRDVAGPCGSHVNLTNAVIVTWGL